MAPPREELNRPLTSAEFDPRKHIIFSTKSAKKEYKKRGMKLVSDAEKRRIARLVELEQRAEKIREKEERKKKNALKRKAKEDKEKERGIVRVPKKLKVTSSQPKLVGFLQSRRKKVEVEEEQEEGDDEGGEEEGDDEEQTDEESGEDNESGNDEVEDQNPESSEVEDLEDSDDEPEPRTVLGEQSVNVVRSRGRTKKFSESSKKPPPPPPPKRKRGRPKKSTPPSQWRRNPQVPTIEEEALEEDEEMVLPWDATCNTKTSPAVNRKALQLQSIHNHAYKPAKVTEATSVTHDPSQRQATPDEAQATSSRAQTNSPQPQSKTDEVEDEDGYDEDAPEVKHGQSTEGSLQVQEERDDVKEPLFEISDLEDDYDDIAEGVLVQDAQSPSNGAANAEESPPESPASASPAHSPPSVINGIIPKFEDEGPAVLSSKPALEDPTINRSSKVAVDAIPDSEDEFGLLDDDDDLLDVPEAAPSCRDPRVETIVQREATPVEEEQAIPVRFGPFKQPTQHVFSLSPLDPSLPSSPVKRSEPAKMNAPSQFPTTPCPIRPSAPMAQSSIEVVNEEPAPLLRDPSPQPIVHDPAINHDDDDDDDLFSSSFPMTQCENIILSAQTKTPARTYPHLPPLLEDKEEPEITAPMLASASTPAVPPMAEPTLNRNPSYLGALGSSFFDEDCVLTDDEHHNDENEEDDDATVVDESILTPRPLPPPSPPQQQPQNIIHTTYPNTGNLNDFHDPTDYDDDDYENDIPPSAQPPRPAESDEFGSFEINGSALMAVMATPSRPPAPQQPATTVQVSPQQQAPSSSYGNSDEFDDESMLVLDQVAAILGTNTSVHPTTTSTIGGGTAGVGCVSQASSSSYGDCDFTAEEASILDYIGT